MLRRLCLRPARRGVEVRLYRHAGWSSAVSRDGQAIALTPTEFRLLHYLMRHAGRVVSSRALMQQLWRDDRPANTDPLRVAIHRLRRKLGDTASPTGMLQSVAGIGIMLKTGAA